MPQIVLLNGPPHCGKDTLVKELIPYLKFKHVKFAGPLKRAIAGALDLRLSDIEDRKEQPVKAFGELTIRRLLIDLSEEHMKPRYGKDIFGKLLWNDIKNSANSLFLVSDCGFHEEVERIISNNGSHNCLLIRIHRDGCDFSQDSRSYIRDGLCETFDIDNNRSLTWLASFGLRCIERKFKVEFEKEPPWRAL